MTYFEAAHKILQKATYPLNAAEIWQEIIKNGYDKNLSVSKTPVATLGAMIYIRIQRQKDCPFIFASKRPTTFWLKARQNELENLKSENSQTKEKIPQEKKEKFNERDLHPLLVKFLGESPNFRLNAKTIYHEKSKKSEGGKDKWNYPDIVGVSFYFDDFEKETLTFLQNTNQSRFKLYSFELKIALNFSNLKECYFQAVSNSSWANEGYLVVFNELDDEITEELRRLNQSFGIGVINLNSDTLSSKILLGAKERELDLQTLDMLVNKNIDFKEFIIDINDSIKINKVSGKFDKVLDDEKIQNYINEKHISQEN